MTIAPLSKRAALRTSELDELTIGKRAGMRKPLARCDFSKPGGATSDDLGLEQPVNALLGLGHGLFLSQCQGTQSRSGKQGQVGARGIDAHTPSGPMPLSAGFRCNHLSGQWASLMAGRRLRLTSQQKQSS
jgi:hypothetical protein